MSSHTSSPTASPSLPRLPSLSVSSDPPSTHPTQPTFIPISDLHVSLPILPSLSNTHPMLTRSKTGTIIPQAHLTHISNELKPLSVSSALANPLWKKAMQDEFSAL